LSAELGGDKGIDDKSITLRLYSATSGNCSYSSDARHRLGRTCSPIYRL